MNSTRTKRTRYGKPLVYLAFSLVLAAPFILAIREKAKEGPSARREDVLDARLRMYGRDGNSPYILHARTGPDGDELEKVFLEIHNQNHSYWFAMNNFDIRFMVVSRANMRARAELNFVYDGRDYTGEIWIQRGLEPKEAAMLCCRLFDKLYRVWRNQEILEYNSHIGVYLANDVAAEAEFIPVRRATPVR